MCRLPGCHISRTRCDLNLGIFFRFRTSSHPTNLCPFPCAILNADAISSIDVASPASKTHHSKTSSSSLKPLTAQGPNTQQLRIACFFKLVKPIKRNLESKEEEASINTNKSATIIINARRFCFVRSVHPDRQISVTRNHKRKVVCCDSWSATIIRHQLPPI